MAQVLEAQLHKEAINVTDHTAITAKTAGEVVQLADGRAGVVATTLAAGDKGAAYFAGEFSMLKTASVCILEGQELWWVKSTGKVSYTGDFPVGVAMADAAAADTEVVVALNVKVNPVISLDKGQWTYGVTDGLGVVDTGNIKKLAFDAIEEVAMAALYSDDTIALAEGPIMETWAAVYDIGDDAALDISIGLANGTHATDFDSVTEAALVHLDGSDLSALVESDDGTTEVAAADSTIDLVDDTYAFIQIDARDLADVKVYINGVDAGALATETLVLTDATGPVFPIVHLEKTSNNTTAELRVKSMHVRTGRQV